MDNNDSKVDKILEAITEIKVTLERHSVLHEKNTDDLDHHIKRTDLNEARIDKIEDRQHELELSIAKDKSFVMGNWKAVIFIGSVISGVVGLLKTLGLI